MPKVGNKHYAYTPKGMAEAEKARKKKNRLVLFLVAPLMVHRFL